MIPLYILAEFCMMVLNIERSKTQAGLAICI
jgi:hypothetical protein